MPSTKEELIKLLNSLPDEATWEDAQYSIYVRERIERGLSEASSGGLLSQEEAEARMEEWLRE